MPQDGMEIVSHVAAVRLAGGEPVILRNDNEPGVIEKLEIQGMLFSGGGDIRASRYGGNEVLANERLNPQRDAFEFALMEYALERRFPIFAVCRGMQVANVVLGGTLIEDLRHHLGANYHLPHHQKRDADLPPGAYAHEIAIRPGALLQELAESERIAVNSFHHQAIGKLASTLQITARADDDVIEAVELINTVGEERNGGFFIGLQWHPEGLPGDRLSQLLYRHFVNACKV
jgi:putative glutamine amidotransferase